MRFERVYNQMRKSGLPEQREFIRPPLLFLGLPFRGRKTFMSKDLVLQLRYLGVMPRSGSREYSFTIEDKDKALRQVALTIDDGIFIQNQLMFQEAPDLCYQKLLADIVGETAGAPIRSRASVTTQEIACYRDTHPIGRPRNKSRMKRTE
jgi:hypothetical protein